MTAASSSFPPPRFALSGRMGLLGLLVVLSACEARPPPLDPQVAASWVLAGDLLHASRQASALDTRGDPSALQLQAGLRRWSVVAGQRRALGQASRELLRDSIEERISAGQLSGAAAHLTVALAAWPDDPAFLTLAQVLGKAAEEEPSDTDTNTDTDTDTNTKIAAWQALSEVLADRPDQAAVWRLRATRASLTQAYGPRLDQTRAGQSGVTRSAAAALLRQVDHEYVDQPDWAVLSAQARKRLELVVATPGARATWPKSVDLRWPPADGMDVQGAVADLDAAIAAGGVAGIPPAVVVDEWVTGALGALDPWTRAVWPAEIQEWTAHNAGLSVGVGLELDEDQGRVFVARPLPHTTAWTQGVHQDDILRWVGTPDGLVLDDLPPDQRLDAAAWALTGDVGSVVDVGLQRAEQSLTFSLTRAPVIQETVQGYVRDADNRWLPWLDEDAGIAYVRILTFRPPTEDDLDALLSPVASRARVVVIDLRGNPGGDVNAAVQIADRFVASGWLTQIAGRVLPETGPDEDPVTGAPLAEWNQAVPGNALEDAIPVVLVDGGTASAAEVLAGALQDGAGATVVGSPTWGKGYAQALRSEPEQGYALQLTNLVWTTPTGRRLVHADGGGILPQISLGPASPGEDFRLSWQADERAALHRHADGSPMHPVGMLPRKDLPELTEDPTILAALLVARARLMQP